MMMRGVEMSKKASVWKRLKNTVYLLVPLIFTAFGKVNDIANAMDLRGYGKHKKRTWFAENEPTKWDKIFRVLTIVLLIATVYYVVMYRFINPWPAKFWCPWLAREEVISVNAIDTIFFMDWFKK